ncbi:hypothetical protein [Streptomyces exfoliatus]
MPNTPLSDQDATPTASLAERIEAGRDELSPAAAQADECQDIAGLFGWAY